MRAAVYRNYGPPEVVKVEEVPTPTPKDDEVLVRVRATTVSSGDWRLRTATVPPGLGLLVRLAVGITGPRKPILGTELAGEITALGSRVTRFEVGDRVFALTGMTLGGHAEFCTIREDSALARMPTNWSFEEAATLAFGGTTALFYVRDQTKVRPGERVLVNGASGTVGAALVQIARHAGAEVTAVCSAANADLVRSLGATHVIDYTTEDFATSGKTWDVILDTVGNCSFARCAPAMTPGGRLGLIVGGLGALVGATVRPNRGGRRVYAGVSAERAEDLRTLAELAETRVLRPVIDAVFPLERIVEAHARVDTHRKAGSVVVTLNPREDGPSSPR